MSIYGAQVAQAPAKPRSMGGTALRSMGGTALRSMGGTCVSHLSIYIAYV